MENYQGLTDSDNQDKYGSHPLGWGIFLAISGIIITILGHTLDLSSSEEKPMRIVGPTILSIGLVLIVIGSILVVYMAKKADKGTNQQTSHTVTHRFLPSVAPVNTTNDQNTNTAMNLPTSFVLHQEQSTVPPSAGVQSENEAASAKQNKTLSPKQPKESLEYSMAWLNLEQQKLQLEREKFEFEKQKSTLHAKEVGAEIEKKNPKK